MRLSTIFRCYHILFGKLRKKGHTGIASTVPGWRGWLDPIDRARNRCYFFSRFYNNRIFLSFIPPPFLPNTDGVYFPTRYFIIESAENHTTAIWVFPLSIYLFSGPTHVIYSGIVVHDTCNPARAGQGGFH